MEDNTEMGTDYIFGCRFKLMRASVRHKVSPFNLAVIIIFSLFGASMTVAQAEPSEAAQNGKDIYDGLASGSLAGVTASFPAMGVEFPAASFPCASCHGQDGKGGLRVSDVRQVILAQELVGVTEGGRQRVAYTLGDFRRAVIEGVDPSGNELSERMPRFTFNQDQTTALWAYLSFLNASGSKNGKIDEDLECNGTAP